MPTIRPWRSASAAATNLPPNVLASLPFWQQKAFQHHEMTGNAADEGLVISHLPANGGEPHLRHRALNFSACIFLLPVEALAASHGTGHITAVRNLWDSLKRAAGCL